MISAAHTALPTRGADPVEPPTPQPPGRALEVEMGERINQKISDRIRQLEQLRRLANALSPEKLELLIEWAEGLKRENEAVDPRFRR